MSAPCPRRTTPWSASLASIVTLSTIVIPLLTRLQAAPADRALAVAADLRWRAVAATALRVPPVRITLQAIEAAAPEDGAARLGVVLGGVTRRIALAPHSLRGPRFRVLAQHADGALTPVTVPPATTWRGRIEGVPGSRVCAARVAGEWHATVSLPRADGTPERWSISPLRGLAPGAPAGIAVVAQVEDLGTSRATCAVVAPGGAPLQAAPSPADAERLRALSPERVLTVQLGCDADFEFYGLNGGSVSNTVADIEAVLNGVSFIYEIDLQAALEIGTIIVRTAEPDPYSSTNASTLLAQLRGEWMANQAPVVRDAVQLFTGKDLDGTTIGNAYVDGMCSKSTGYSLVQSRFSTVLDNRVEDSAHELAHNLDAVHCDYDDFDCRIMCSSIGGCAGGIHSFGPSEETRIRAYLPGCTCLDTATVQIDHATLPFNESFPGSTLNASRWTAADRAAVSFGHLELGACPSNRF